MPNPLTFRRSFAASCPWSGHCAGRPACPSRSTPRRRWWPGMPSMPAPRSSTTSPRWRAIRPCSRWRSKRVAGFAPCTCGARREPCKTSPVYADVVAEVMSYLRGRRDVLLAAGIAQDRIALDPGIGFGKTTEHNLQLLANARRFHALGCPVLVGHSRKRFLTDGARGRLPFGANRDRHDHAGASRRATFSPPRSHGRHHWRGVVGWPDRGCANPPRPRRCGRPPGPLALPSHRWPVIKPRPVACYKAATGAALRSPNLNHLVLSMGLIADQGKGS